MAPPSLKPLPGYTVQGRNGESSGRDDLVANGVTIGLAIVAVVLRMTFKSVKKVTVEDYLVILACLLATARTVMYVLRTYSALA